jgi:hypothetical protein
VDVKKYLLDKIVRLSFVPENSLTNIPDWMSVAPEEQSKGVSVACANAGEKCFVSEFRREFGNSWHD